LGNFVNVEAYGRETTSFLRMGIFENGNYIEVHPTFLYEMIVTLFLFIILSFKKRKFKGELTYIYLIIYSFARIFIEGLRVDSLMLGDMRISQIVSIIICVVFSVLYGFSYYLTVYPKTPASGV